MFKSIASTARTHLSSAPVRASLSRDRHHIQINRTCMPLQPVLNIFILALSISTRSLHSNPTDLFRQIPPHPAALQPNPKPLPAMAEPIPNLTLPSSIFNRSLLTSIYDLWFQDIPLDAGAPGPEARHRWFGMDATAEQKAAFDASCAALCLPALEHLSPSRVALPAAVSAASPASYAAVAAPFLALPVFADAAVEAAVKADAMLSLVLLFDQMPRNIHRAVQAQAPIYTHYDTIARALVYSVISDADADAASASPVRGLHRHPAVFASSLKFNWYLLPLMHSEDLADHDLLLKVAQPKEEQLGLLLQMEKRHRVLLERFGRYPHRNVQLGRSMTEEERVFLREGGDTFGTG